MLFTIYLGTLVVLLFVFLWKQKQLKYNYPPGLPVWPIIGSVPNFLKIKHLHVAIEEWAREFGQVFSGRAFTTPVLFVTGVDNVMAALRKKEFQGRPKGGKIRITPSATANCLGIFFNDGQQWADSKKFTARYLKSIDHALLEQFVTKEIRSLSDSIKDGSVIEATGLFSLTSINFMWLIIGNKYVEREDKNTATFMSNNKTFFRSGTAFGALGDVYSFLQFLHSPFQKRLNHGKQVQNIIKELIDEHKQTLDPNNPVDLIDNYLVEMDKRKDNDIFTFSEKNLITTCFDLFMAGSETIAATLEFVLLYMVLNPEVQNKMQDEIDTVLMDSRTPKIEDRNRLPYTVAVLNEVVRINPTAPVGVPHRCTKDTYFNDFYIEKDTTIVIDFWSASYDPKYWDKPEEFLPERFLNAEGYLKKTTGYVPFSMGKRICTGETLTKNVIFQFVVTFFKKYSLSLPDGGTETQHGSYYWFHHGATAF